MKEIELKPQTQLEIVANQKKQIEHELIGHIIPYNGHRIWEVNLSTKEVNEAKYANTTYNAFAENKKEVIIKQGFVYVSALNKKNALIKAMKGTISGKEINQNPLKLHIY